MGPPKSQNGGMTEWWNDGKSPQIPKDKTINSTHINQFINVTGWDEVTLHIRARGSSVKHMTIIKSKLTKHIQAKDKDSH